MANKSKKIQSEISAGELLDKISILEIKLDKIKDENSYTTIEKKRIEEMKTEVRELNKKTSILIPEYIINQE